LEIVIDPQNALLKDTDDLELFELLDLLDPLDPLEPIELLELVELVELSDIEVVALLSLPSPSSEDGHSTITAGVIGDSTTGLNAVCGKRPGGANLSPPSGMMRDLRRSEALLATFFAFIIGVGVAGCCFCFCPANGLDRLGGGVSFAAGERGSRGERGKGERG
jgi:hypothetical protein